MRPPNVYPLFGEFLTIRTICERYGHKETTIRDRWERGDRDAKLVRPFGLRQSLAAIACHERRKRGELPPTYAERGQLIQAKAWGSR